MWYYNSQPSSTIREILPSKEMISAILLTSSRILVSIGVGWLVRLLPLSEELTYSSLLPLLKKILSPVQSPTSFNGLVSSLVAQLDSVLYYIQSLNGFLTQQHSIEFFSYCQTPISFIHPSLDALLNSILFYLIVFWVPSSSTTQSLKWLPGLRTLSICERKSTYICSWVHFPTACQCPIHYRHKKTMIWPDLTHHFTIPFANSLNNLEFDVYKIKDATETSLLSKKLKVESCLATVASISMHDCRRFESWIQLSASKIAALMHRFRLLVLDWIDSTWLFFSQSPVFQRAAIGEKVSRNRCSRCDGHKSRTHTNGPSSNSKFSLSQPHTRPEMSIFGTLRSTIFRDYQIPITSVIHDKLKILEMSWNQVTLASIHASIMCKTFMEKLANYPRLEQNLPSPPQEIPGAWQNCNDDCIQAEGSSSRRVSGRQDRCPSCSAEFEDKKLFPTSSIGWTEYNFVEEIVAYHCPQHIANHFLQHFARFNLDDETCSFKRCHANLRFLDEAVSRSPCRT